jgi:hypothetical protein
MNESTFLSCENKEKKNVVRGNFTLSTNTLETPTNAFSLSRSVLGGKQCGTFVKKKVSKRE